MLAAAIERAKSTEADAVRSAMEGLEVDSIKGKVTMRKCDHQGEQQGFVVQVAKTEDFAHPVPAILKTYPAGKITPPCNKMTYDD